MFEPFSYSITAERGTISIPLSFILGIISLRALSVEGGGWPILMAFPVERDSWVSRSNFCLICSSSDEWSMKQSSYWQRVGRLLHRMYGDPKFLSLWNRLNDAKIWQSQLPFFSKAMTTKDDIRVLENSDGPRRLFEWKSKTSSKRARKGVVDEFKALSPRLKKVWKG